MSIYGPEPKLPPHIAPQITKIVPNGFASVEALGFILAEDGVYSGAPLILEENDYKIVSENGELTCDPPQDFLQEYERSSAHHYRLRIRSQAGILTLRFKGPNLNATLTLEVFPSKIDYKIDYETIVDDLEALAKGLSFTFLGQTLAAGASTDSARSAVDWAQRAEAVAGEIYSGIAHLASHGSKAEIVTSSNVVSYLKALRMPSGRLRDKSLVAVKSGAHTVRIFRRVETSDTPVNRFIRHEVRAIRQKITSTIAVLRRRLVNDRSPAFSLARLIGSLERANFFLQRSEQFDFVASASAIRVSDRIAVMSRMDPRYSRLLNNLSLFRRVASLHVNRKDVSPERIWQLYEWWTFYKIAASMAKYLRPASPKFLITSLEQGEITILSGQANAIDFIHPKTGDIARLIYRSRSLQSATVPQEPDALFEVSTLGGWYVFDAKYRIQYDESYLRRYKMPGPHEGDINTAHRYRDAVLSRYRRIVKGSYIIFPFRPEKRFANHLLFKSIKIVDVGAIPLLPGGDALLDYVVRRLLRKSLKGPTAA